MPDCAKRCCNGSAAARFLKIATGILVILSISSSRPGNQPAIFDRLTGLRGHHTPLRLSRLHGLFASVNSFPVLSLTASSCKDELHDARSTSHFVTHNA